MGVGHHYCPLRRSILQPRDVNAIEQLRTAREATTIDSCGYRCAGCLRVLIPIEKSRRLRRRHCLCSRTRDPEQR